MRCCASLPSPLGRGEKRRREIRRCSNDTPNEILSILSIPAMGCELRKHAQPRRDHMLAAQAKAWAFDGKRRPFLAASVINRTQGSTMRATDCTAVESPEFLLAALEQAADAVLILDGDLRVSHCNAAAETIWASPRAELLGRDATSSGCMTCSNRLPRSRYDAATAAVSARRCRCRASSSVAAAIIWYLPATSPPSSSGGTGSRC